jgi:hypothetical protein
MLDQERIPDCRFSSCPRQSKVPQIHRSRIAPATLATTSQTWRRVNLELGRLHLVTLSGPASPVEQTTALTSIQGELLTAIGIVPPPRVTSLHPA